MTLIILTITVYQLLSYATDMVNIFKRLKCDESTRDQCCLRDRPTTDDVDGKYCLQRG